MVKGKIRPSTEDKTLEIREFACVPRKNEMVEYNGESYSVHLVIHRDISEEVKFEVCIEMN